MSSGNNKTMSWGWIIVWFIIFWPVGLFFLFRKLSTDRTATLKNSKTVGTISYILIGMGIIYLIMAITENSSLFVAAILFGGAGVWVRNISKKMKVKGEKYKKYIMLIVNQSQTSIDYIAAAIGVTYDEVYKDLQEMINTGYFVNAFINESSRSIVLTQTTPQPVRQTVTEQIQTKVVTCNSCGAENAIIAGQVNECEYCGSLLQ